LGTFLLKTGVAFGLNGIKLRPLKKEEIRKEIISDTHIQNYDVRLAGGFLFETNEKESYQRIEWAREQKKMQKV
jgi:hypothetical protein